MKILCTEYNATGAIGIVPVGDDALLRNNDDFYLPAFGKEWSCVPQPVVRICKLGKCVSERFAGRYYEEAGMGIRFYADDLERTLREQGLPEGIASSFGGSAAISVLLPREECGEGEYALAVNGEKVFEGSIARHPATPEQLIALASEFHTLKIGDFLYTGNRFRHRGLQAGDRLQVTFNRRTIMDFKIK